MEANRKSRTGKGRRKAQDLTRYPKEAKGKYKSIFERIWIFVHSFYFRAETRKESQLTKVVGKLGKEERKSTMMTAEEKKSASRIQLQSSGFSVIVTVPIGERGSANGCGITRRGERESWKVLWGGGNGVDLRGLNQTI